MRENKKQDNITPKQYKEPKTLTFSEAIKNLKIYINEMKNEIKKRNERDYKEMELQLQQELD